MLKPIILMGATEPDEYKLKKVLADPNWIAEKKWNGSRYQALIDEKGVRIFSKRIWVERTGNLPHICEEIKKLNLPVGTILDGEIIHPQATKKTAMTMVNSVMNSDPPHAIGVQNRNGYVEYKIFDMPIYKGMPLKTTLIERKNLLKWEYFKDKKFKYIEFVEGVTDNKQAFYDKIVSNEGEGIVIKNLDSVYAIGTTDAVKNGAWLKMKEIITYDCVVIGGVEGTGKYKGCLGALVIAQYRNGKLTDVGKVSGMNDKQRRDWWQKIQQNQIRSFTIDGKKRIEMKQEGYFIIEIEAMNQTESKYFQPRFVRVRDDKPAKECIWEDGE